MDNGAVLIGKKPMISYVLAVLTHINSGNDLVVIKARGSLISKAVDVSQIVMRKFSQGLAITKIDVGTEELKGEDSKIRKVSFISIEMKKGI